MGLSLTKINDLYILSAAFGVFATTIYLFFQNNKKEIQYSIINKQNEIKKVLEDQQLSNQQNKKLVQEIQETVTQQKEEINKLKMLYELKETEFLEHLDQKQRELQEITQPQNEIKKNKLAKSTSPLDEKDLSYQLNQLQFQKENEIHNLNQKILKSQQIKYYDDYDLVIDFPNVDSFIFDKASWTIFVCDSLYKSYESLLEDNDNDINKIDYPLNKLLKGSHKFNTACVVGNFNRGKTFVINLINECNLPSGRRTKIKGLSIIISQNNSTLFIDTQGCNTPLPNNNTENNETLKEIYNINIEQNDYTDQKLNNIHLARKRETELFHQEVALGLSKVVMHVVNEMTWNDQLNIIALQRKIMSQYDLKPLYYEYNIDRIIYVIHNYMNVNNEKDLMKNFNTYVKTPFKGHIQSYYDEKCTIFYYEDAPNHTTHFFLCDNNSEFGKKWNTAVASIIRSNIKSIWNENIEFDKLLLKTFENSMKAHIQDPSSLKIINYDESKAPQHKNCDKIQNNLFNKKKNDTNPQYFKKLEEYEYLYDIIINNEVDITQKPLFSIVPKEAVLDPKNFALKNQKVSFVDDFIFNGGCNQFCDCFIFNAILMYRDRE